MTQHVVRFNTSDHTLSIGWADNSGYTDKHENVMTIREGAGYYEILQRQENGKNAPIYRLPINNTIVRYFHQ